VTEIDNKLEDIQEEAPKTPLTAATPKSSSVNDDSVVSEDAALDASFMSESIYQKLPSHSPRSLKQRSISTVYQSLLLYHPPLTTLRETLDAYPTRTLRARITDQGNASPY
jgi:division protein 1